MSPGARRFEHRLAFSPGYGRLGRERLYAFRLAYSPNSWLGYEAGLGHNPGDAVHALLNTLSVVVRRPFAGRLQPYATAGYGMMLVFPGESLNTDPVTKNALALGAGLEVYVRNDVALRGEMRRTTILGGQRGVEGTVAYDYDEATIGLAFYRDLGP
jgi:opacity protein-like surface antigen